MSNNSGHLNFDPSRQDTLKITSKSTRMIGTVTNFWTEFKVLFLAFLLLVRNSLPFLLFFQTVVPLAFVFAMGHYAGYRPANEQLIHIVAGTITFNLAYLGLMSVASRLSWMREEGSLLYYCALPINKASFILALLCSRTLMILPSMIIPILGGMLMYNLDLNIELWLPVIIILGTFVLAIIGTTLGVLIKNNELLLVITNSLIFVMALASPTFLTAASLPWPLQLLGWLMPTTYISEAITLSLSGQYGITFIVDIAMLIVMGGLGLLFTAKFLEWRNN